MSRLRRTGTGDLRPPHLGPYPDTTFQIRGPHRTCPGTSSSGTALFSSPLEEEQQLGVPVVGRERPAVAEDDGLSGAPVLVVDLDAVGGGDGGHGSSSGGAGAGCRASGARRPPRRGRRRQSRNVPGRASWRAGSE